MNRKYRIFILGAMTLLLIMVMLVLPKLGNVTAVPNSDQNTIGTVTAASDQTGTANIDAVKGSSESMTWSMVKLIGALALVVLGIYGFLYVLRRMMGGKLSSNKGNRLIEVLETTFVAQKKSVSLVRFGERAVLIGISEGNMTPLAELGSEETAKILTAATVEKAAPGFKNILHDAREKWLSLGLKKAASDLAAVDLKRPETV